GTGELILDAVRHGCREVIVWLGGSATNDGGAGMLQALGWRLLDTDGREIGAGGYEAGRLARIDDSNVSAAVRQLKVTIASDVTAPLSGPGGASYTFAPQKGASPEMLPLLDSALSRYADVVTRFAGEDFTEAPGAGAAGGLGFALMALMRGETLAGAELVLDMAGFDEMLQEADLVITGEGRLDAQTLMGKGPVVVLNRAMSRDVPVVAIAGALDSSDATLLREAGFKDVYGISDPALPAEIAMNPSTTIRNIEATVREKLPQWLA
ncbi:MAG: glycerate kinase, partial [Muribaculaceae bacterium]|nr:glycerate kinase [Muribaculaceae bacterium]